MDPKKAITERTEAAARDLYGARPAERLRPVGYMQIETKETWKQLGCGAVSFLIAFAVVLILARVYSRTHSRPGWSGHYCKMLASTGLELGSADPCWFRQLLKTRTASFEGENWARHGRTVGSEPPRKPAGRVMGAKDGVLVVALCGCRLASYVRHFGFCLKPVI